MQSIRILIRAGEIWLILGCLVLIIGKGPGGTAPGPIGPLLTLMFAMIGLGLGSAGLIASFRPGAWSANRGAAGS